MPSKLNGFNGSMSPNPNSDRPHIVDGDRSTPTEDHLNNMKRDRFELLSAYLDGEVTPHERRQVEYWLKTDRNIQLLYTRLLQLQSQVRTLPVPSSERSSVEDIVAGVNRRIHRSSRRRYVFGGAAIAALFCAVFSTQMPSLQLGHSVVNTTSDDDSLNLPLDIPVIPIPEPGSVDPGVGLTSAPKADSEKVEPTTESETKSQTEERDKESDEDEDGLPSASEDTL